MSHNQIPQFRVPTHVLNHRQVAVTDVSNNNSIDQTNLRSNNNNHTLGILCTTVLYFERLARVKHPDSQT
eukprot:m.214144 g.214144  ORF g.214144 m.214144 type:complete len:70 (+) comp15097_c1_seq2:307-516(+)